MSEPTSTDIAFFDIALASSLEAMGVEVADSDRHYASVPVTNYQREALLDLLDQAGEVMTDEVDLSILADFERVLRRLDPEA